jgi:6-phosphogluconate dehydrogenase
MQLGMIGLGRMGANMVRRLLRTGHECVVFDSSAANVQALVQEGARGSKTLDEFVAMLDKPRAIWIMVPAGAVDAVLGDLAPKLDAGDILIDGGNSYYIDDIRRAKHFEPQRLQYVDVGTSGGVWGLERGYCLMIGGTTEAVTRLDPIFRSLSPGRGATPPTPGRPENGGTADQGYLHCGPVGAGHFVKMVHNGIEYGLMAAYAEGLNVLSKADIGSETHTDDAETAPLANPEFYRYDLDLAAVTEVWRRGSVVASWLLDLTADALAADPELEAYEGRVSDSGEGRWTISAAIDEGVPVPVLSCALYERFESRGRADVADKILSAMRAGFGGHIERTESSR